jgi:tetratricopeptide (TPR) repeat protein
MWDALEPHIVWAEHLALILLFATHPLGVDELRGRAAGVLEADGRTLRVLIPRDLGELGSLTGELVARPEAGVGAVWVELWRGSGDAEWDRGVADQLGRMNEVRSLIERKLGRPLVLVLPTALRTSFYAMAPDLWTIRSFTAVVPSPAAVTRGLVEREAAQTPKIFAIGPPSAAEREWARLMAHADAMGRVDPWDGFRAVEAAMQRGSLLSARTIALQVLEVAKALAEAVPESSPAQRDLSVACNCLGDVELEAGNLSAARGLYQRSLNVREGLVKADPDSVQAQRDLSVSLNKLGDVEMAAGELLAARGLYQRALDIVEELARADPDSAKAQRDLSVLLGKLGNVELEAGNSSSARGLYQRSLDAREEAANADPDSAQAQRDLSVLLGKLGNVEMEAGNLSAARGHFQRSLDIREALANADPDIAQAQRDLSMSLRKLGNVEMEAGNLSAARGHYQRSIYIHEGLAQADLLNSQASFDVVDSHLCLVALAERADDTNAMVYHSRAASERMRELEANGHVTGYREREAARDRIQQLERELGS